MAENILSKCESDAKKICSILEDGAVTQDAISKYEKLLERDGLLEDRMKRTYLSSIAYSEGVKTIRELLNNYPIESVIKGLDLYLRKHGDSLFDYKKYKDI
jgi:hypothetical protein